MQSRGEQDGGGAGGHGVHLSPQTHQEYSSDTEGQAGVPDQWKRIQRTMHNLGRKN